MKNYFNLQFPCCTINICFDGFENEYIDFFTKIYSSYLDVSLPKIGVYYETSLKKEGEQFIVLPNDLIRDIQNIKDLYNVIHSIICNSICLTCNEKNLIVLHASSFILKDKLILLAGIKSSGKTTALLYFLMNNAVYVGDEIVVVSSDGVLPYHMPLRAKVNTIKYLESEYNYKFNFLVLPSAVDSKKQYLSYGNNWKTKRIDSWIKCSEIIFLTESDSLGELQALSDYEAINGLLRCIRNKTSISIGLPFIKEANKYRTDFSIPLEKVKSILCE